jgi:kynurenine formamidase
MKRTFIDLSHVVEEGMTTYPGLPGPAFEDFLTREESRSNLHPETAFHIGTIRMVGNTGTYLDSPFHRFEGGADLADLPLSSLADLPVLAVRPDPASGRGVGADVFRSCQVEGKAVLVETGWSRHWGTPRYGERNPFLTREAAALLRDRGAALVGVDSVNIDDMEDPLRPAHTLLLGAGIPVVEHLTKLDSLPEGGCRFFAVPVKVRRFGTFPVRAFALVE